MHVGIGPSQLCWGEKAAKIMPRIVQYPLYHLNQARVVLTLFTFFGYNECSSISHCLLCLSWGAGEGKRNDDSLLTVSKDKQLDKHCGWLNRCHQSTKGSGSSKNIVAIASCTQNPMSVAGL